jgi:hypothetical protein
MSFVRRLLALLLVSAALVRPAAATDWSDIWWNPAESGWGVNFIQSSNFIFATFFVYGPNKQPFWYTGQLTQQSNGTWTGPVYQTTGTYFGNPWNGPDYGATQVGTATFTPTNSYSGSFVYNISGATNVVVTKQIQRQTLTAIPVGGTYRGAYQSVFTNCNDPNNNGPIDYDARVVVTQTAAGSITLAVDSKDPFTMSGLYIQNGLLYRIPGASYALAGKTMTAAVSELKATSQGLEGTWTADVGAAYPGCLENGYFSLLFLPS